MTALLQVGDRRSRKSAFELEGIAALSPGSAKQPTRGGHGLLQRLLEPDCTRKDGGLRLRLAVAAHRSVNHRSPIFESCRCRVQRVKRLLARLQRLQVFWIQTERRAAILPIEPGRRQYDAAAKFVINALDERYGQAVGVDYAHPDGIAGFRCAAPWQRSLQADLFCQCV